jgi:hypothetical protein
MYIENTHLFRGFKLTFADWLKFSLIEELTCEIDVWFQEKTQNNDALDLIWSWVIMKLGHCFKAVTFPYFYLFVSLNIVSRSIYEMIWLMLPKAINHRNPSKLQSFSDTYHLISISIKVDIPQ